MVVYILMIYNYYGKSELIGVFDKEHIRSALLQAKRKHKELGYKMSYKALKVSVNEVVHDLGLPL